eukprot:scaffold644_cov126-Isochrysis_galbana.AAC.2
MWSVLHDVAGALLAIKARVKNPFITPLCNSREEAIKADTRHNSHEEDIKADTGHIQGAHKTTKGSTLIEDESVGDRFYGRRIEEGGAIGG